MSSFCSIRAMESGDSSSSLFEEMCSQPKWMIQAQKLSRSLSPIHSSSLDSLAQEEDEEISEEKILLTSQLDIYHKAIPCNQEPTMNTVCLQAMSNKLDDKALVATKVVAASWLLLVSSEHKDFFKKRMFEWALKYKVKGTVKYLVRKEKLEVTKPTNLMGDIPLMVACEAGEQSIVRFLLKHGGLPEENKKEVYKKVLQAAQRYNRDEVVAVLKPYAPSNCIVS